MSSKLLTILQSKNIIIPENLINDLRSSKAMIEILKLDKLNKDILIEVENYLINIEMKIMILTENELGKESYDKLLNEIKINNKKQIQDKTYSFSYGVPRNESWIRIKYSKELKIKTIREITEELKRTIGTVKKGD